MKIKKAYFCFFVVVVFFLTTSITTENKKALVLIQAYHTPDIVLQTILQAKKSEKIYICVSENSLQTQINMHPDVSFDTSLFTFTGWNPQPRLSDIYAYMYEDAEKFVVFLGSQASSLFNIPAHELGHLFSSLLGHVSSDPDWMKICDHIWQNEILNPYFVPSGQRAGRGLTARQQASEELFAECIAGWAEGKLDTFIGEKSSVIVKNYVKNYVKNK